VSIPTYQQQLKHPASAYQQLFHDPAYQQQFLYSAYQQQFKYPVYQQQQFRYLAPMYQHQQPHQQFQYSAQPAPAAVTTCGSSFGFRSRLKAW
jgi:hypothetical protein